MHWSEILALLNDALLPILAAVTLGLIASFSRTFLKSDTLPRALNAELQTQILELRRTIEKVRAESSSVPLSDTERKAFKQILLKRVSEDLTTEVVQSELAKLITAQEAAKERDPYMDLAIAATERLRRQIDALGGRANLSLILGLMLALVGVFSLLWFVQTSPTGTDFAQFLVHFIPRLSVVTVVELFSFFFLRLYKQAIDEIKYFQNEISNIDMRVLALTAARNLSPESVPVVVTALVSTERNFLVPKDQRIVSEIVDAQMHTTVQSLLDAIKATLSRGNAA